MSPPDPPADAPSTAEPSADGSRDSSLRRFLTKALFVLNPVARARRIVALRAQVEALDAALWEVRGDTQRLHHELEEIRADARVPRLETRADRAEEALRRLQDALEDLRDVRAATLEVRLDALESAVAEVGSVAAELRDERVPSAVRRGDALIDRLARQLEEVASLVERLLVREPLPLVRSSKTEEEIADALRDIQPVLVETFRGSEAEITHRLDRYLPVLRQHEPVLDLGCGRGELLLVLREAGVEALGIEGDPALAQAARRRGLKIVEGDVCDVLSQRPTASCGAVTAIHLLEHLEPADLIVVLHEIARVLRPGGVFIAECPNPHSVRVGASLFWLDPTHRRPLLPETLRVFLEAAGFAPSDTEWLHPFPFEQSFEAVVSGGDATSEALVRIARRLDTLVNGPRDFSIRAVKPARAGT